MGNERKDKLCRKHANELKEGIIIQCEKCGAWHEKTAACKNCGGGYSIKKSIFPNQILA